MKEAFAVIMAGGSGTRFWPLSRSAWPKQFLPLTGSSESLLQATARRISGLVAPENIYVVTSEAHAEATARQLKTLPRDNILAEPVGRNTAPCVGWAALRVHERQPDAVMLVLPSDPRIEDEAGFRETVRHALNAAEAGSLVTIGIRPTRPETGYGYLEVGESRENGVFYVRRFVEKPDEAQARGFVAAGNYLWNSGMFFFRADAILKAIARQLPELGAALESIRGAVRQRREMEEVRRVYPTLKPISIDYGVMERAEDILVVPGSFGWHDIGSWTTAWELADKDGRGNCAIGESVLIDAGDCYVRGPEGKVVALVGVRDLVVVDTPDALLVIPRERAQEVRQVVDRLRERGAKRFI